MIGAPPPPLLVISLDGLRPRDYCDPTNRGPGGGLLCRLAKQGVYAESVQPVFPSVTLTNHVSLVTGVSSARHGIYCNTHFDPKRVSDWPKGEPVDWHFDESRIQAPTLWQLAKKQGLRVAILRWPVSRGAQVDWLIPEIFPIGELNGHLWHLTRAESTPSLMARIEALPGFRPPTRHEDIDELMCRVCELLIREDRPDMIFMHLSSFDHEVHEHGQHSVAARLALERSELQIEGLLKSIDFHRMRVILLGDHGFMDFDKRVHINALLARHDWLEASDGKIRKWDAVAHTNCSQAAIFLRDPARTEELLRLLHAHSGSAYRVIESEELRSLGAHPGAVCAIDCQRGYSLGQNLEGDWIQDVDATHGEHGYLPVHPEIQTGFIAVGAGIPRGINLGRMSILDVAPTMAWLMGLDIPQTEEKNVLSAA